MRHFLQMKDFTRDEYEHLFVRAKLLKERFKNYIPYQPLTDRMLAMVFEKSSTRTRVSFEAGIYQLGGQAIHLDSQSTQLGRSEPIEDTARVISRMVDLVMIRTFEQEKVERFAAHSRVPVIFVGQPVDDRHPRMRGESFDLFLLEGANHHQIDQRDPGQRDSPAAASHHQ